MPHIQKAIYYASSQVSRIIKPVVNAITNYYCIHVTEDKISIKNCVHKTIRFLKAYPCILINNNLLIEISVTKILTRHKTIFIQRLINNLKANSQSILVNNITLWRRKPQQGIKSLCIPFI